MSAATPIERIAASHASRSPRLAGDAAWRRRRGQALERLAGRGLPDRRDENWRYFDHAAVAAGSFDAPPDAGVDEATLAPRLLPLPAARRIVLVDGRYDPRLSAADRGDGVQVSDLGELMTRDPAGALALLREPGDDADDRFALLADAFTGCGVVIRVAAGAAPVEPLYLLQVASAARPATHHARLVIELGAGARLTLIEHFLSLGDEASLGNLAAEIRIGAGAALTQLRLHLSGEHASQIETWVAQVAAAGRLEQHLIATGGGLLRSNLRLALDGAGAECSLAGLAVVDGTRLVDLHTQVEHLGPSTRTRQDYRGIASGRGRGAFNGRIVVHPGARGADAAQSSRNLLLSPLAEINTRPQLEIQVDEVQCRHGATTGTLDPDQLFYLLARGLDPDMARAILTYAFCADLIAGLPVPALRDVLSASVAAGLPDRELLRSLR